MATIGTFTRTENGFTGAVKTLTLNVKARITPSEKSNEKAPDFRIFAGQAGLLAFSTGAGAVGATTVGLLGGRRRSPWVSFISPWHVVYWPAHWSPSSLLPTPLMPSRRRSAALLRVTRIAWREWESRRHR